MSTGYRTYDELLEAESSGWVVVIVAHENTPNKPLFTNVLGPWPKGREGKRLATNCAARTRARWKRTYDGWSPSTLIKVSVRPIWTEQ